MRDLLRLPALLLFFVVLLLIILTGIDLLSTWGVELSAGREEALRLTGARLLPALRNALPVAVLIALVLGLFRTSLKPGSRFVSLVIPLALGFVLLAFGYQALDSLQRRLTGPAAAATADARYSPQRYLTAERFTEADGVVLYVSELSGDTLKGAVLYEAERGAQRLRYEPRGAVEAGEGGLGVRFGGAVRELPAQPVYAPLFRHDPLVRPLIDDVSVLNRELERLFRESRAVFLLFTFAMVFAFYTAGLFFRISRWPLLNVAIALLVLRGYLFLVRLLSGNMVVELEQVFRNPNVVGWLPALILIILGALFFFVDVLFVPRDRWGQEDA
jgi:hypothetical protein